MDVEQIVRKDEGDLGKKIAKLNKPLVNRIIGHGEEQVDQLLANPLNFRLHPDNQQQALAGAIDDIGFIRSVTVNQRTGRVVDGHLRVTLAARSGVETLPVEYVDLDEAEEAQALLSLDPIAAMAASDKAKLDELMRAVQSDDERVQAMISEIAEREGVVSVEAWNPIDKFDGSDNDGIETEAGYRLSSIWYGMNKNNNPRKYMLELPINPNASNGATVKLKYSRTNAEEVERSIKTYMRPGDYFFEMCCGWMTFSSSAKYFGFSGKGGDIWDVSLEFCKRQIDSMPGQGNVEVVYADCRDTKEPSNTYDFVHSNPPFFSLEPYGESDKDLASMGSYERWLDAMGDMGREAERILKPGGLANFVINDYRKDGELIPMHADFINAIKNKSGLALHDLVVAEVVSQALRFRKHDYERRRTVKCHEYVITFKKQFTD